MKTGLATNRAIRIVLITCVLCLSSFFSVVAYDDVPEVIPFAGINLHLNQEARRQIRTHMDFLLNRKYLIQPKLPALQAYLSVVGEILQKNNLPQDYKYLALQERQIYPDYTSDEAVGYWKLNTRLAREVGLEINEKIDERFNLVISTEKTAEYLSSKNLYFDNWAFTMLTLKLGYQKTKTYMFTRFRKRSNIIGAQTLEINEDTHPFIRKFIAQKLAFESLLTPESRIQLKLIKYNQGANKTLPQIARKFKVSPEELRQQNPWLKKRRIPANKIYPVIILKPGVTKNNIPHNETTSIPEGFNPGPRRDSKELENDPYKRSIEELQRELLRQQELEYEEEMKGKRQAPHISPQNSKKQNMPVTHTVLPGQDVFTIARQYNISVTKLRRMNNLRSDEDVFEGQLILIQPFNIPDTDTDTAPAYPPSDIDQQKPYKETHIVNRGETLYSIAKKYNISITNLRLKNNIKAGSVLQVGQELIIFDSSQNKTKFRSPSPDSNQEKKPIIPKKRNDARLREKLLDYHPGVKRRIPPPEPLSKLSDSKKISMYFRR